MSDEWSGTCPKCNHVPPPARTRLCVMHEAREQAIRDCIAAVEIGHPRGVRWWADWLFWSKFRRRLVTYGYDWHKRDAVEVLRALLEEKP